MWMGGLTELIKVAAMAAAYDIPVVPHGCVRTFVTAQLRKGTLKVGVQQNRSGPYSFSAIASFPNSEFCEYIVSFGCSTLHALSALID
jgi:L-rhamnonate dehydratase